MRWIEVLPLAAAVASLHGCSTLPRAAELESENAQVIAWTKGTHAAPFRDQHGVCHMFTRDTRAALQALGEQVKACFEGSLPRVIVEKPGAKSVRVAWNRIPRDRINDAYAELSDNGLMATSMRRKSPAPQITVRGFFTHAGGTCHVVVPDRPDYVGTLGHEFKHCVDGLFHDERGEWIQREQAI